MTLWSTGRRLSHILIVLLRHAFAVLLVRAAYHWPLLDEFCAARLSGPERLRAVLEELGGTFIKFGQMLALQPDVLSFAYCNALMGLLDRLEPFPFQEVDRIFLEELGHGTADLFDFFDKRPIATASVGQVHVAYAGGRKLAVKVQRPSARPAFAGDIQLMTLAVRIINVLGLRRISWVTEPVREFAAWTREELDYRREAGYLRRLRAVSRDSSQEYVPEVIDKYTTSRILTLEFLDGTTVLGYLRAIAANDEFTLGRIRSSGFEPHRFACNLIENFIGDAFRHGIFHADLHPANLMMLPGNLVGYLDFGITGVLSPYSRQHLVAMTLAYTRGDLATMGSAFLKISASASTSNVEGFRSGLEHLATEWYQISGKRRQLRKNFTLVMLDMLSLSRATGVWPERDVIKFIRSAIAIDGLITRFAPGFDVGKHLETTCAKHLRFHSFQRLLSYEALATWTAATGRLLYDGPLRASEWLECCLPAKKPAAYRSSNTYRSRAGIARSLWASITISALLAFALGHSIPTAPNLWAVQVLVIAFAAIIWLRGFHHNFKHRGNHA